MAAKVWFDGVILGQKEIDDLVRQAQDAEDGAMLACGDTLVVRVGGTTTVYTERYVVWDNAPTMEDDA